MIIPEIKRPWIKTTQKRYITENDPIYRSQAWRNLRAQKLRINPYCECPDCIGKEIKADMCDHIIPISEGGAPLDINNLQSMRNHPCHDRKRAREKNAKYVTHNKNAV